MEGDDDDYQDMDNSVVPNQDDDFFFHLEDMQVGSKWFFPLRSAGTPQVILSMSVFEQFWAQCYFIVQAATCKHLQCSVWVTRQVMMCSTVQFTKYNGDCVIG